MDNDLISRQAAIDALDRIFDRCEEIEAHLPDGDPDKEGYKMFPDYMTVWKFLKQIELAQPERKKGRWIYPLTTTKMICECSECGNVNGGGIIPFNFCPNCGADMRGEQDG